MELEAITAVMPFLDSAISQCHVGFLACAIALEGAFFFSLAMKCLSVLISNLKN